MPSGSRKLLLRLKRGGKKRSKLQYSKGLTQKASEKRSFGSLARVALRDSFERGTDFEEACRFVVARYISQVVEYEALGKDKAMIEAERILMESKHNLASSWAQWTYR